MIKVINGDLLEAKEDIYEKIEIRDWYKEEK